MTIIRPEEIVLNAVRAYGRIEVRRLADLIVMDLNMHGWRLRRVEDWIPWWTAPAFFIAGVLTTFGMLKVLS